ncbi:MAG: radical SAM family heme chaperone HemW [Armatimonadetes bacterium]|nr:radical SAM family heme chaperone HemW [Armatimonadota bacterium]
MQPDRTGPGIYVHFPFCIKKCHYCDFNSRVAASAERDLYLTALSREIEKRAAEWDGVQFETVYFGGGTPTTYPPGVLVWVLEYLREHYCVVPDAEITLEANPDTVTPGDLDALLEAGFNRLSLGVQSLRDDDLRFLGRTHDAETAVRAYLAARAAGWRNVNVDLIRGLPMHTADSWRRVLEEVVELAPDHISCYGLTLEPGTRLYARHSRGEFTMPDEDTQLELFRVTADVLAVGGYEHYEVSNWAKPGRACRHNINYWLNGDYVGLGAGAWSHRGDVRWANISDVRAYIVQASRGGDTTEQRDEPARWPRIVEHVTLALRLVGGVGWDHLAMLAGGEERLRLRSAFEELARDGLVWFNDGSIGPTWRGLMLLNEVGCRLLQADAQPG